MFVGDDRKLTLTLDKLTSLTAFNVSKINFKCIGWDSPLTKLGGETERYYMMKTRRWVLKRKKKNRIML